jgi:deoxyribonuclease V
MAERVVERDSFPDNPALGGVDVAYHAGRAFAAAVRCDAEGFDIIESAVTELPVDFPYIPGYLAFREFPGVAAALGRLRKVPDILLVDGHGRLHPALFGLACFIGVRLNLCTIGVAKHPLVGRPARRTEAQEEAIPLVYAGRARGYAWTPPGGAKAIYISVGHRISLRTALETVRRSTRDRYPQPLVEADRLSKETKRKSKEGEGLSQSPDGDRATRESAGLISSFSCPSSS